jgi:hypothetical protein
MSFYQSIYGENITDLITWEWVCEFVELNEITREIQKHSSSPAQESAYTILPSCKSNLYRIPSALFAKL